MVEAALDAKHLGEVGEEWTVELSFGGGAEVGDVVGDLDVAHRGEGGEEVEALEDETDLGAAGAGALSVGEGGEVDAVDENRAGSGSGEPAEDVEESGFAGA